MKEPNAPEILAMLGDIETRLQAAGHVIATSGSKHGLTAPAATNGAHDGALVDLQHGKNAPHLQERGDEHLARFFVTQQLFTEDQVSKALETVRHLNKDLSGQSLAASLLDKLCRQDLDKVDQSLSGLIDRTKFAYVPLEYYDIDRQIARMLPDHLTLGRLFVPFDLISRTIMVACCNPFDTAGREAVQQSLDYTVTWYSRATGRNHQNFAGHLPVGEPGLSS